MKDTRLNIRLEADIQKQFTEWCQENGTTPSDEIRRHIFSKINTYCLTAEQYEELIQLAKEGKQIKQDLLDFLDKFWSFYSGELSRVDFMFDVEEIEKRYRGE